jgi:hypothetical protein
MKLSFHRMSVILLSVASWLGILQSVQADSPIFVYTNRDVLVTFRKTGADGGSTSPSDLEVDLGQVSTYYGAAPGSRITISQFSTSQIGASFDSLNDLSWSLAAFVPIFGDKGDPTYPVKTLWVTSPRPDPSTLGPQWLRHSPTTQATTAAEMNSVAQNAAFYSGIIVADPVNNTSTEVVIPVGSGFEAGAFLTALGNYDNTFQGDVENTTPATFTTDGLPSRSDFYQLEPDSTGTFPVGQYLGYFELETNGSMVFVAGPPAPSAPVLTSAGTSASVSGGVTTVSVSFATVTGGTYTLYYTNSTGLTAPVSAWPSVPTNIIGNGSVQAFQDSTTDPGRFYSVGVH